MTDVLDFTEPPTVLIVDDQETYRAALRAVNGIADVCNKALQDEKPWETLDAPRSRALLWAIGKALHGLAVALGPVMPRFAAN